MKQDSLMNSDSLAESQSAQTHVPLGKDPREKKRRLIGIVLIIAIISVSIVAGVILLTGQKETNNYVEPVRIKMALPSEDPFPIVLGESRVVEVLFFSGFDDRSSQDYRTVNRREVEWTVEPKGILTIDLYGRMETLSLGQVNIKVTSKSSPAVSTERNIKVVTDTEKGEVQKRVVDFAGQPAELNGVLQKVVSYKSKEEAIASAEVPESIKQVILDPQAPRKKEVRHINGAVWTIQAYADGSDRSYVKRISNDDVDARDRVMFFIGTRYLPGDGTEALSIEDDNALGLWVVDSKGAVSHIEMKAINYKEKAEIMVDNTQKYVIRHGLASSANLRNGKWVTEYVDNDGLWTSMYAVGEFMRLSSLRSRAYPDDQVAKARYSALYSLKAVLLISNVASRNITIDAKIRHFNNTRTGHGEMLAPQFLKEGKIFSVDEYVGSSVDGSGFFGVDADKTIDGGYVGGTNKYTFFPFESDDWSKNAELDKPATSKRKLNGFMARSFGIQQLDLPPNGGLIFKHNENGTQTVLSSANKLYDYGKDDHPVLDLGTMQLPQILKDFLKIDGKQYEKSDLIYKGDTSTDEVIGHLFLYKVAYDIFDQTDPQEKTLKDLIRSTLVNFCTCLTNNGYSMVDATGQGTQWGKMTRTFMNSDFTIEDAPIKSLQVLLSFKLCYYVTGDGRWQKEYDFLIADPSFRYLELVASVWKRWTYRAYNEDIIPEFDFRRFNSSVQYTEVEVTRHTIFSIHMSDEEQAMLGYYLAFQLQDNKEYLDLYRKGIEGWWHSISRSENPLWYYIYQLAYPNDPKKDYYGNSLTETASWQLSRNSIDTRVTSAFIEGSRNDVMIEGNQILLTISTDPNKILQKRQHISDKTIFDRAINHKILDNYDSSNIYEFKILPADERCNRRFNGATFEQISCVSSSQMLPSTAYTLPYWMGVYHKMLKLDPAKS